MFSLLISMKFIKKVFSMGTGKGNKTLNEVRWSRERYLNEVLIKL